MNLDRLFVPLVILGVFLFLAGWPYGLWPGGFFGLIFWALWEERS